MKVLQELRDSCLFCVLKHLGQASALMSEARQDYPAHRWLAVGHMAEAAEECCSGFPKLAAEIRKHRVRYMEDLDYVVPIVKLIEMASKLVSEAAAWSPEVVAVLDPQQEKKRRKWGLRRKEEERADRCGSVAVSTLKPGTKVYEKWLKRRTLKTRKTLKAKKA